MNNKMHILIDADSIYFKLCCCTKREKDIRKGLKQKLKEITDNARHFSEEVELFIAVKGVDNFRFSVASDYKGQRKDLEADMKKALNYANNHLIDEYGAVSSTGMEADDLVSIWAHECWANGLTYCVVHIDKDLDIIPGPHYNFDKKEVYSISPDDGFRKFMHQCLTGDRADNIAGIKGIGPKKADKILEGVPANRMWSVVKQSWREHGYKGIDLIKAARLLWMGACSNDISTANLAVINRLERGYDKFWEVEDES